MSDLLPLLVGLLLGAALGGGAVLLVVRGSRAEPSTLAAERAAVAALVAPVQQTLARVSVDLQAAETERARAHAELRAQIDAAAAGTSSLRAETGRLASALRRTDVRGQWGEMQLRRIVEASGLVRHVHFEEQSSTRDDGDLLRADLVVHLADDRHVVVDAKVPMAAYLEAIEADDDATARRLLAKHAADVVTHVDLLGSKEYWRRYDSLELVVLFLPNEALLSSALEVRPDLLQHAFDRDVVLATPTTLLAILRAVAHTWRQEAASRNVAEVHALARELHARIGVLGGHLARLASSLDAAVGAYNGAVGSLESRVLVSARRLADLGVVPEGDDGDAGLPAPRLVTTATRPLGAPELVLLTEPPAPARVPTAEPEPGVTYG
ncbi:MAG: DNA recombination protein RmuC [Candidatus Nanopelagicales bacterium]